MEENEVIKYEGEQLQKIWNAIAITNKLLQSNNKPAEATAIQKNADYYFHQGHQNRYSKKFTEAILDYSKAIEIDSNYSMAFEYRGRVKYELGDYEGAILDYNKSIEIGINMPYYFIYILRGIARINLGKMEEAIIDFDKAIEIEPDNHQAYNDCGYAKEKLGRRNDAKLDYEKSVELEPNYKDAIENLSRLKSKM